MLGAEVNVIAPKTLMPKSIVRMGVKSFTDMKKGLDGCDIVMMLRLQNERMQGLTQDELTEEEIKKQMIGANRMPSVSR